MKYILMPVWWIVALIGLLFELYVFFLYNLGTVIWFFNFKYIETWRKWCITDEDWGYFTDKNIIPTYLRYCKFEWFEQSTRCDMNGN